MFARLTKRTMRAAGALVAIGALCGAVQAEILIADGNGDMELGYISGTNDTVPAGFSQDPAVRGSSRMRMDFDTKHSGEASLQIIAADEYAFWRFSLSNVHEGPAGMYKLGGYVKTEALSRYIQILAYRACGGGGYCSMNNVTIVRESGTNDWTNFEVDFDMPTEAQCIEACPVRRPMVTCQIQVRGPGTAWFDSLYLIPPETGTIEPQAAISNHTASGLRLSGNTVHFDEATNYQVAVLGADGRVVSTTRGFGREVSVAAGNLAAGAYVVRVSTNGSTSTHMLAVQ